MLQRAHKIGLTVQNLSNTSSSKGVTIPAEWIDDLELEAGDLVDAEYDRDQGTITFHCER